MKLLTVFLILFLNVVCFADSLQVELVTTEAEAVLSILAKKKAGESITDADWRLLFDSEPYMRLKKREEQMKRAFTDDEFRAFVLSGELASRQDALRDTLESWKHADLKAVSELSLAYLPAGAAIRARIYPVIKPKTNSFVFETETNPAIFLYIDPKQTREQFENTLAHELHHIGYSAACPEDTTERAANVAAVRMWAGAFGEGLAMLAAAGGPDRHPHAASAEEDRQRWDRDVANFNTDLKKVERFFQEVLDNKLTEAQIRETAFSFYGVQGPWYTVGWKMGMIVETKLGREALISAMCDPVQLLRSYNQAAKSSEEPLATWSDALLNAL